MDVVVAFISISQGSGKLLPTRRRDGREAEGGGLLNRYTGQNLYRGFESLSLRQIPVIPSSAESCELWSQCIFYITRVLVRGIGCTVVAHMVSRVFIAAAASLLTVFT